MRITHTAFIGLLVVSVSLLTAGSLLLPGLFAPSTSDVRVLAAEIEASCTGGDQPCMEKDVLDLVRSHGPEVSIDTLAELLSRGVMHGKGDYHDFVHRIGRQTAKKEGLNPDGFFLCPVDYNYGCQHGFFEQALVEEPDAKKAAEMICDASLMKDRPLKFFFYCYHGVGHGIMMARAYDLRASLDLCDGFPGTDERAGCEQGVFMENVVGYMNGTSTQGSFSDADLLAPCKGLPERQRQQCYLNHGGYLASKAGTGTGAVERASSPCLNAGAPGDIRDCLESVGLNATNPGWQAALDPVPGGDFVQNAVEICDHFPAGYEINCILAAVNNQVNFDRDDTRTVSQFCEGVDEQYVSDCFLQIGSAVKNEVPAGTPPETICAGIPDSGRSTCILGAS